MLRCRHDSCEGLWDGHKLSDARTENYTMATKYHKVVEVEGLFDRNCS